MNYQVFKSIQQAQNALSFPLLVPDSLLGVRRTCYIRWTDPHTDTFFQSYISLTPGQGGGLRASRNLLFAQGYGARCSTDTAGAPKSQSGTFRLPDGRQAVWAIGLPELGWARSGPAWVAWPSKNAKNTLRVEGTGYGIATIRTLANQISADGAL